MAFELPDIVEDILLKAQEVSAALDAVEVLRGGFLLTACAVRSSCPTEFTMVMRLLTVHISDSSS